MNLIVKGLTSLAVFCSFVYNQNVTVDSDLQQEDILRVGLSTDLV